MRHKFGLLDERLIVTRSFASYPFLLLVDNDREQFDLKFQGSITGEVSLENVLSRREREEAEFLVSTLGLSYR